MITEDQFKAIEKFAERVKKYYGNLGGVVPAGMVVYYIDQLVKEYKKEGE